MIADKIANLSDLLFAGRWRRFATLFLTGALLSRAQAPYDFFPLIFIVFPILYQAYIGATSVKSAFWRGWQAGFGYFLVGLVWIGSSFHQQSHTPPELAPFAVVALTAFLALYTAVGFALSYWLRPNAILRPLVFAGSWVLFEFLRGILFTGFPWNLVGTLWANWLWVAQASAHITVYGLGFLTILCGLIPWYIGKALNNRGETRVIGPGLAICGLSLVTLIGLSLYGFLRLDAHPTDYHTALTLRMVQANIAQRDKWNRSLVDQHFDSHMDLTRTPRQTRNESTRLLIWPEVTVQYLGFERPNSLSKYRISRSLAPGAVALVGGRRIERGDDGSERLYNSLFATGATGNILGIYDKKHLVPFGEYLPLASILSAVGLEQLTGGRGFNSGEGPTLLKLDGIPAFEVLICYETIFPGRVIRGGETTSDDKPEWLLNISNDAWFGASEGPYQHLAQARLRAIEEGLPIVRSTGAGVSAVIDPLGRIVAKLALDTRGILDHRLPKKLDDAYRPSNLLKSENRIYIIILLIVLIHIATLYSIVRCKEM